MKTETPSTTEYLFLHSLYPTFKEWKQTLYSLLSIFVWIVYILPLRNENDITMQDLINVIVLVYILPLRNENNFKTLIVYVFVFVYILPLRNENF